MIFPAHLSGIFSFSRLFFICGVNGTKRRRIIWGISHVRRLKSLSIRSIFRPCNGRVRPTDQHALFSVLLELDLYRSSSGNLQTSKLNSICVMSTLLTLSSKSTYDAEGEFRPQYSCLTQRKTLLERLFSMLVTDDLDQKRFVNWEMPKVSSTCFSSERYRLVEGKTRKIFKLFSSSSSVQTSTNVFCLSHEHSERRVSSFYTKCFHRVTRFSFSVECTDWVIYVSFVNESRCRLCSRRELLTIRKKVACRSKRKEMKREMWKKEWNFQKFLLKHSRFDSET